MEHKWYAINCTECGAAIGYTWIQNQHVAGLKCLHCAHSHAEVANWMMPVGSDYGTNGLYGVQNLGYAMTFQMQFRKTWSKLFAKLDQHRIAKCDTKRLAK